MIQTMNEYQFTQAFKEIRPNNFSYEGLKALFDWFEEYEEGTGEKVELDVIGICCDFSEYDSLKEYNDDYGTEYEEIEAIADDTTLINIDDEKFIIQQH